MINTTIYFFNENINNFNNIILNLSMFLAFLSAVAVIATKNTIHSVLFLISLFLSISVYLCLIDFTFIGLSYLLVYVGAVSVLFIFILMLINIRNSELLSYTSNSIPLMVIVSSLFAIAIGTPLNINNPVYNIYILYKEE
jgi:NADH-ubiquinone oxidoreductase chain 6